MHCEKVGGGSNTSWASEFQDIAAQNALADSVEKIDADPSALDTLRKQHVAWKSLKEEKDNLIKEMLQQGQTRAETDQTTRTETIRRLEHLIEDMETIAPNDPRLPGFKARLEDLKKK